MKIFILFTCIFMLAGCQSDSTSTLIVGDSISLGYTPHVQTVDPNATHNGPCFEQPYRPVVGQDNNAEWSGHAAKCINAWLATGHYSVVHVGVGMWDLLACEPQGVTPLSDYLQNLQTILDAIRASGARPIFATITPVLPDNKYCVDPALVKQYNDALRSMMQSQGVQVDDLYGDMLPYQSQYHLPQDIHFDNAGYEFLASEVLGSFDSAH